jgi:ornithine cyclodeaminase/alanine dehydrogenase-like protein (mu-crystallin family)
VVLAAGAGAGAVSARNCSTAATTAAASVSEAASVTSRMFGLGGLRSPFLDIDAHSNLGTVSTVPVLDGEAVLAAVEPAAAIERVRLAFERYAQGEWAMPAKVYLDSPPNGDFRAMPARGEGFASLKWVTSFPGNSDRGLPVVTGALLLSDSATGELVAVMDCASITSLRTGAAAALSAQVLGAPAASSVGIVGCGVNGAWAARCLAAAGYGPGVCADVRPEAAQAVASELGWRTGDRADAATQDVIVTVTPGSRPVILEPDLRPGQHIAALGADAKGKAELDLAALKRCRPFCDEWAQAAAGGELSGAVAAGLLAQRDVTQLGDVILGRAEGRRSEDEITLFDSTGLAIQDLGIAIAVHEAWRAGRVQAELASL